jgi:hypothetical protein
MRPPVWREAYLAAYRAIDGNRERAAPMFEKLAADRPADRVPHLTAVRLRTADP